jgi:hypothetical protein
MTSRRSSRLSGPGSSRWPPACWATRPRPRTSCSTPCLADSVGVALQVAKVRQPAPQDRLTDREIVDAFMAAARGGDLERLIGLLAPDAGVTADVAAIAAGTPERIAGRRQVAEFFDGSAHAALAVTHGNRPATRGSTAASPRCCSTSRPPTGRCSPSSPAPIPACWGASPDARPPTSPDARPPTPPDARPPIEERNAHEVHDLPPAGRPVRSGAPGRQRRRRPQRTGPHLKDAEKAGDASHQPARDAMRGRWRHPRKSLGWYRDMKAAFAALPETS